MKLMCIKNGLWFSHFLKENTDGPIYGQIVEAEQSDDENYYYLPQYPVNRYGITRKFLKTHFIPLSTIDETELLEQRQEQLTLSYTQGGIL